MTRGQTFVCHSQKRQEGRSTGKALAGQKKLGTVPVQRGMGAMVFYAADFAFVVTTSTYTESAKTLAARDSRITLIDGTRLVDDGALLGPRHT